MMNYFSMIATHLSLRKSEVSLFNFFKTIMLVKCKSASLWSLKVAYLFKVFAIL